MALNNKRPAPAIRLRKAALSLGGRGLWRGLDLDVSPGEFIAVLGPNGSGKTSFLRVLLGLLPLTSGQVDIVGLPPERGSSRVGYIPQRASFDPELPLRGRDLVRLGIDGHRIGPALPNPAIAQRVDQLVRQVGATRYADAPIGLLSGGEQQRLRIAQALAGEPQVLLCDEPLLSLDLSHQQGVTELIDERRRSANTAVIFVTHEINPILRMVDRVLYLANGRFAVGAPDDVLTTERLSELYGTHVDVVRVHDRVIVVAGGEATAEDAGHHPHKQDDTR